MPAAAYIPAAPAAATNPEVINFRRVISLLMHDLLRNGSAPRDHGANAFSKSGEANHRYMNDKKQNKQTGREEMNRACGLLATKNRNDCRDDRNDRWRHSETGPEHHRKRNEDDQEIGDSLEKVVGELFVRCRRLQTKMIPDGPTNSLPI